MPSPAPTNERKRGLGLVLCATAAILATIGIAVGLLTAGKSSVPSSARPSGPEARQQAQHAKPRQRLFAPDSVWNKPLADDAPIDPKSAGMISELEKEVDHEQGNGNGPWINTNQYSTALYQVPKNQSVQRVVLDGDDVALQKAFDRVPLPPDAQAAKGTDAHMTVWQPSTDKLWEFWGMREVGDKWHARWGGAMQHVSRSPGYFSTESWPGAQPYWGATATSLPAIGGTMRIEELKSGKIHHALAMSVPAARAGVWSRPAQRTDGKSQSPNSLPEGARLRLDPSLNLDRLELPPTTLAIARAAQKYGIIVRDQASIVTFVAEDSAPYGEDPYAQIFGGKSPTELLAKFPWNRLQVMQLDLQEQQP